MRSSGTDTEWPVQEPFIQERFEDGRLMSLWKLHTSPTRLVILRRKTFISAARSSRSPHNLGIKLDKSRDLCGKELTELSKFTVKQSQFNSHGLNRLSLRILFTSWKVHRSLSSTGRPLLWHSSGQDPTYFVLFHCYTCTAFPLPPT